MRPCSGQPLRRMAEGGIHGIENYWSLRKRGLYRVFHHISVGHLPHYLDSSSSGLTDGRSATPSGSLL